MGAFDISVYMLSLYMQHKAIYYILFYWTAVAVVLHIYTIQQWC